MQAPITHYRGTASDDQLARLTALGCRVWPEMTWNDAGALLRLAEGYRQALERAGRYRDGMTWQQMKDGMVQLRQAAEAKGE